MIVKIEKIVNGGYGLARTDRGVCLIPYSVPGDVLNVECSKETSPIFCWIREIEKPSNYRINSECPNFTVCGGCDFQHIDYNFEVEIKKDILKEDLKRIAKVNIDKIDILKSFEFNYRNNVQFKTDALGNIGFFRKKSTEVVPLPSTSDGCLLIDKKINNFIVDLKDRINFKKGGFRVRTNSRGDIYKKGIPGINNDSYCYYNALDLIYRVAIDGFFQVNNYLYEKWLKLILDYVNPDNADTVIDLFSGSGFVTLAIALWANFVYGMEINGSAIANARYNSMINDINNVKFKRVDVNRGFYIKEKFTKVIADPPRSGLSKLLINEITEARPEIIVYASCNTATFSRDVGLMYKHGYKIDKITMVDLFPRTSHLEVVARLTKV